MLYSNKLQKLLEMEELHSTPLADKTECSNSSVHIRVSRLSASWSCDKENSVLNSVSFEVDQVLCLSDDCMLFQDGV